MSGLAIDQSQPEGPPRLHRTTQNCVRGHAALAAGLTDVAQGLGQFENTQPLARYFFGLIHFGISSSHNLILPVGVLWEKVSCTLGVISWIIL